MNDLPINLVMCHSLWLSFSANSLCFNNVYLCDRWLIDFCQCFYTCWKHFVGSILLLQCLLTGTKLCIIACCTSWISLWLTLTWFLWKLLTVCASALFMCNVIIVLPGIAIASVFVGSVFLLWDLLTGMKVYGLVDAHPRFHYYIANFFTSVCFCNWQCGSMIFIEVKVSVRPNAGHCKIITTKKVS